MTRIGAQYLGNNRCEFRVWAPLPRQVALRIITPNERDLSLDRDDLGYWQTTLDDVAPGSRYWYLLDGTTQRSDPASQSQPESIHGPSEVVDHGSFPWTDAGWEGVPLEDLVIYELHVGAFTPEGTFEAVIPRLAELRDLGITAIELMPVAQFPGDRNWGYDGAYPYAAQNTYGGPTGLKTLVNAIHRHGMSAILDVVYNHMGPEGSYLRDFGPYFTGRHRTPWGDAINFDEAYSYGVRNFVIENALFWLREYHFDALRLDALHMVFDLGARHIIQELTDAVAEFSRQFVPKRYLIGESDLDDVRFIKPARDGGHGLDAQWLDDFHHSLHALATGEDMGYYEDFGRIEQLAKAMKEGFRLFLAILQTPQEIPRKQFPATSGPTVRRLRPESRPHRQPDARRATLPAGGFRIAQAHRRNAAAVAVHPTAVHGGGIRGGFAIPVLRQSHG